jgi:hypothetical protein
VPGITGKAQIDQATKKFLAESRYTLQERPGVFWSSFRIEKLGAHQGPSVNIPKYGTVTTFALSEGVDMAQAQQITDTLMTLTPAEFGAQVVLSDMMVMTVKDEFFRVAGRILGDSFGRQREQTLADDQSNWSSTGGSAGTAAHSGHFMSAAEAIAYGNPAAGAGRGGEPGPDPIIGIITPAISHSVRKGLSGAVQAVGAAGQSNTPTPMSAAREYDLGSVLLKTSVDIDKDASDDAVVGVSSKEATIGVELGAGPAVERQRDASLRGTELNFVGRWARGEYNDGWGVAYTLDSATPVA